jgi:hypothetical protein
LNHGGVFIKFPEGKGDGKFEASHGTAVFFTLRQAYLWPTPIKA